MLECANHGERIEVACKRWRRCPGCAMRKQWELAGRFRVAIQKPPKGMFPAFVTLTFPEDRAPTAAEAHECLRRLISKLRYRKLLAGYGWVLQRQENGTLHYHGIFFMKWFRDDLELWRKLVEESGFGSQQFIERAKPEHARYCSKYISHRLADLEEGQRAYGFSRDFPAAPAFDPAEGSIFGGPAQEGAGECEWEPLLGAGKYCRIYSGTEIPWWVFDPLPADRGDDRLLDRSLDCRRRENTQ